MAITDAKTRVIIAVTEPGWIAHLWQAALRRLSETPGDLVTLFLEDERWLRAASLPFTREFSRIGGRPVDFTPQRAQEISKDAATQARRLIDRLAAEAKIRTVFEILSASDRMRLSKLIGGQENILIAPSFIRTLPVYTHLVEMGCRIQLIEETGQEVRE